MKNVALLIILFAISLICVISCSKCKDQVEEPPCGTFGCPSGFECVDGACLCPEGNLSLDGNCIPLDANTFVGYNSMCFCYDTLALAFLGEGTERIVQMPIVINGAVGGASTQASYFERPDGDSIHIQQLPLRCFIQDTIPAYPEAFGKIQSDGSLRLNLIFRHGISYKVLDSCMLTLKKR